MAEQRALPEAPAASTTRITLPPGAGLPLHGATNGGAFGIGK